MIFNICPRALKYTVTLNGAPGETISYTGTASGSVVLDAHGAGTIADVKRGTYAFTGSVSGYTKSSVSITGDATVNVYPDGAIFWYGNGDTSGDSLYSKLGGWSFVDGAHPDAGTGYWGYCSGSTGTDKFSISISVPGTSGSTYAGTVFSTNAISLTGYSVIKALLSGSRTSGGGWGFPSAVVDRSSAWETSLFTVNSITDTNHIESINITGGRTSGHFAASLYSATHGTYGTINTYAIWLE